MNDYLYTIDTPSETTHHNDDPTKPHTLFEHLMPILKENEAIRALESGKIVYLPKQPFALLESEQHLLSETILDLKHKNISYNYNKRRLGGCNATHRTPLLETFMHRFAIYSKQLIDSLLPQYVAKMQWGRTSYRPAEIKGRKSSKRKDDTRVHVDSFPATPVNGLRILRVFCNINPEGLPRVWHIGEPFSQVLETFFAKIPNYSPVKAQLLRLIKSTKTLRTSYDHYMLHLHDLMKLDDTYQNTVTKQRIDFPSQSTWVVFTDHVSHAALSGQFLLEQTFYVPVDAMDNPNLSPYKQLQQKKLLYHST